MVQGYVTYVGDADKGQWYVVSLVWFFKTLIRASPIFDTIYGLLFF